LLKCNNVISVKIHPELTENTKLNKLATDFKHYKKTGKSSPLFGRDSPFSEVAQLKNSNISKVHIIQENHYKEHLSQYENTSDHLHLIYCQHYLNENCFCIIHALSPDAHKEARKQEFISVALRRAEDFQGTEVQISVNDVVNR